MIACPPALRTAASISGESVATTTGPTAAACARLLGLDPAQTAMALGIAGTQAAGLKSMFGTMCKPLHAGKAGVAGIKGAVQRADAGAVKSNRCYRPLDQ